MLYIKNLATIFEMRCVAVEGGVRTLIRDVQSLGSYQEMLCDMHLDLRNC